MMDFCCQIVATRDLDRPETLILRGLQDFSLYSHSMVGLCLLLYMVANVLCEYYIYTYYTHSTTYFTILCPICARRSGVMIPAL